jgi:selenide,water dikinase
LGGGHSIDPRADFLGLAVNGIVDVKHVKQNDKAEAGNILFLANWRGYFDHRRKEIIVKARKTKTAANRMMEPQ